MPWYLHHGSVPPRPSWKNMNNYLPVSQQKSKSQTQDTDVELFCSQAQYPILWRRSGSSKSSGTGWLGWDVGHLCGPRCVERMPGLKTHQLASKYVDLPFIASTEMPVSSPKSQI